MEEIYLRRSIRKYISERISDEVLEKILKAGMNAPSAKNTKPYEFIIVRDKSKLEKLSMATEHAYMVKDSDLTIIVLGKEETFFWQLDLGATIQNMLLEARHYGIGSCWIGINKEQEQEVKKEFAVPAEWNIISMVSFGYPAKEKEKNDNYYPNKIHYEKY